MGIKFSQLPIASSVASDDYLAVLDTSEGVLKRTPINHASQGSAYGLSTTTEYGHSKLIDNLTTSSLTEGQALAARQGNVLANDMGQVETSTTAAYAHSAGEYFILIGQFVKCLQNIAVGGTITLGTNVEATSIGAVLGQLNSNIGSVNTKIGQSDISNIATTITGALLEVDRYKLRMKWRYEGDCNDWTNNELVIASAPGSTDIDNLPVAQTRFAILIIELLADPKRIIQFAIEQGGNCYTRSGGQYSSGVDLVTWSDWKKLAFEITT